MSGYGIGIDFGGTKIAGALLTADGQELALARRETPRDYEACRAAVLSLIQELERALPPGSGPASLGLGLPGLVTGAGKVVSGDSLPWSWIAPLPDDLAATLKRPLRTANDADCFALSEARDGAGAGFKTMFAITLGTGMGGAVVVGGQLVQGPHGMTSEWGHLPMPWLEPADLPLRRCPCGRMGCSETYLAGRVLAEDYGAPAPILAEALAAGEARAKEVLLAYADRLGRALTAMVTVLDPDVIVMGGGLSTLPGLLPATLTVMARHALPGTAGTLLKRARHGPTSARRGAAFLGMELL